MNRPTLTGATVKRRTARAVLVEVQGRAVWLPLALVTLSAAGSLSLPAWLAQDRGLTVEAPAQVSPLAAAIAAAPRGPIGYGSRGHRQRAELAAEEADGQELPRGSAAWRRAYGRAMGDLL